MLWKNTDYAGWAQVHKARGQVARPERRAGLDRLMHDSPAPAFGMLRSYNDSPLNDGGQAIDMSRMDKILAFDGETGVIELEAGVQLGDLIRLFAPRGWVPAVVPGTGFPRWCRAPAFRPSAAPSPMTSTARTTMCSAPSASMCWR